MGWICGTLELKICRLYQMAYHKGLDLWNIGSQLKLYGLYKVTSYIGLDHSLGHFCISKCHVSFLLTSIFMSSLKPSWNKNYMYLTQETKIWCIMVSSRRRFVRSFTKKNQKVLMRIEEMVDVFLNLANFAPHAFFTSAPSTTSTML